MIVSLSYTKTICSPVAALFLTRYQASNSINYFLVYNYHHFHFTTMPPNTEDSPMSEAYHHETRHIVVIGLGMVAVSFIEKVLSYDTDRTYHISVFSEENQGTQVNRY